MAKTVLPDKKKLFTSKLNLQLKKRITECLVWHCQDLDVDLSRQTKDQKLLKCRYREELKGSVGQIKS